LAKRTDTVVALSRFLVPVSVYSSRDIR